MGTFKLTLNRILLHVGYKKEYFDDIYIFRPAGRLPPVNKRTSKRVDEFILHHHHRPPRLPRPPPLALQVHPPLVLPVPQVPLVRYRWPAVRAKACPIEYIQYICKVHDSYKQALSLFVMATLLPFLFVPAALFFSRHIHSLFSARAHIITLYSQMITKHSSPTRLPPPHSCMSSPSTDRLVPSLHALLMSTATLASTHTSTQTNIYDTSRGGIQVGAECTRKETPCSYRPCQHCFAPPCLPPRSRLPLRPAVGGGFKDGLT